MESSNIDVTTISPPITPISTLIKSLCVSSTTIRTDICSMLSKTDFSDISVADISSKKVTKKVIAENIIKLTNIIENINTSLNPVFNCETLSEALDNIGNTNNKQLQSDFNAQIVTSTGIIKAVDDAIKQHTADVNTKLDELHEVVNKLSHSESPLSSSGAFVTADISDKPVSHDFKHIDDITDNFITTDTCDALLNFFANEDFRTEGIRGVATYGAKYNYMGHKSQPKQLPPCLSSLVDEINKNNTSGKYEINQCLVNKFEGPDSALPEHADDEYDIDPTSDIFTISIGDTRTITFKNNFSGDEIKHTPTPGSLYVMSRDSQNYYTHRIDKDPLFTGMRYSITFRCVHWRFLNSTCIIGDSNTSNIKFGTEKKTVGASTPGKQVFAAVVEDIDPKCCASYSNVVLMVGTNNLKASTISVAHVKSIYSKYKGKIAEIKKLNKKCKIFVVPVLPTKLMTVNRKIIRFNDFIFDDLARSFECVSTVEGSAQFLDRDSGLLSESLSRYRGDPLHINSAGVGMLVTFIKNAIFQRKKSSKNHSNKAGGSTVSRRPP